MVDTITGFPNTSLKSCNGGTQVVDILAAAVTIEHIRHDHHVISISATADKAPYWIADHQLNLNFTLTHIFPQTRDYFPCSLKTLAYALDDRLPW